MIRLFTFIFLLVISFKSSAFVPAAVYLAGDAAAAGASTGNPAFAAGAGAFAVGVYGGYVLFEDLMGHLTRLPNQDEGPNGEHAVPPPQNVPQTVQPVYVYGWNSQFAGCTGLQGASGAGFGSMAAARNDAMNSINSFCHYTGTNVLVACPNMDDRFASTGNPTNCFLYPSTTVQGTGYSCPPGYTFTNSSCVLADPRKAKPDNNCDLKRVNGVYTNLDDPDCAPDNELYKQCLAMGNKCTIRFIDQDGNPTSVNVQPRPDGGTDIDHYHQKPTQGGVTPVQHTHVGVDPSTSPSTPPKVGTVSGDVGTGSVPSDGTQPVQTTPQTSIQFPSDYARQGEAAQGAKDVVNGLKPGLDKIHDDLTKTENLVDPTLPKIDDMPKWGTTFDSLLAWRLPSHVSDCPKPVFDFQNILGVGKVFTMSSHCDIFESKGNVIFNSMIVFWSLTSLFIVLRA